MSTKIDRQHIMNVAVSLAQEYGYQNITRDQIAETAAVSTGTVSNALGTMRQARRKIMRHALRTKNHKIVAQGIVVGDPLPQKKLSVKERRHILRTVL